MVLQGLVVIKEARLVQKEKQGKRELKVLEEKQELYLEVRMVKMVETVGMEGRILHQALYQQVMDFLV